MDRPTDHQIASSNRLTQNPPYGPPVHPPLTSYWHSHRLPPLPPLRTQSPAQPVQGPPQQQHNPQAAVPWENQRPAPPGEGPPPQQQNPQVAVPRGNQRSASPGEGPPQRRQNPQVAVPWGNRRPAPPGEGPPPQQQNPRDAVSWKIQRPVYHREMKELRKALIPQPSQSSKHAFAQPVTLRESVSFERNCFTERIHDLQRDSTAKQRRIDTLENDLRLEREKYHQVWKTFGEGLKDMATVKDVTRRTHDLVSAQCQPSTNHVSLDASRENIGATHVRKPIAEKGKSTDAVAMVIVGADVARERPGVHKKQKTDGESA